MLNLKKVLVLKEAEVKTKFSYYLNSEKYSPLIKVISIENVVFDELIEDLDVINGPLVILVYEHDNQIVKFFKDFEDIYKDKPNITKIKEFINSLFLIVSEHSNLKEDVLKPLDIISESSFDIRKLSILTAWDRVSKICIEAQKQVNACLKEIVLNAIKREDEKNRIYLNAESIIYLQELRYNLEEIDNANFILPFQTNFIQHSILNKILKDVMNFKPDADIINDLCYAGGFELCCSTWEDINSMIEEYI